MNVFELKPSEISQASQTLARAFFDYPDLSYYFPNPEKKLPQLTWMLRSGLVQTSRIGKVLKTEDSLGILAMLLPYSRRLNFWDLLASETFIAPFIMSRESLNRMRFCENYYLEKHHQLLAGKPHYYIWYLGVEPVSQGKGIGSALINHVQALARQTKLPVYLETHKPVTVAYYKHLGFKVLEESSIPGHPIKFYSLLWEPSEP